MTLQSFLTHVGPAPEEALRRAMTSALSVERPSSPESFARFYRRVIAELDRSVTTSQLPSGGDSTGGVRAA